MSVLESSLLGKKVSYKSTYDNQLLYGIPRALNRSSLGIEGTSLPFHGEDLWNLYELSWLDPKGKPVVATAEVRFAIDGINLVESKSFKLYLNSFNQMVFDTHEQVRKTMEKDLGDVTKGQVKVLLDPDSLKTIMVANGICIDDQDVNIDTYAFDPELLKGAMADNTVVGEKLCSHLFKSNCPVTGQPDWASIFIDYSGPAINRKQLLQYLVSFREHEEFHEQCVERIFTDIKHYCHATQLTVLARYTRRGGLDINPLRTDANRVEYKNSRLERQ